METPKKRTHRCTIGGLRNGTMRYITTPHFIQNWCADMHTIGAEWGNVGGRGSWIFKPEHLPQVIAWARSYFPVEEEQPKASRELGALTMKEEFAVAMGLGILEQQDLND